MRTLASGARHALVSFLVGSLILSAGRSGLAENPTATKPPNTGVSKKPTIARSRFFLGGEAGLLLLGAAWIDGKRVENESGYPGAGIQGGYSQGFGNGHFGLLTLGRVSTADTSWSQSRGEDRWRVDLAVGPEFRIAGRDTKRRTTPCFSLPIGVTAAWIGAGPERSVQEEYSTGFGINLGINVAVDITGAHSGAYFGSSFVTHVIWIDHTSTLSSQHTTSVEQKYRFLDHALMLNAGYVYEL